MLNDLTELTPVKLVDDDGEETDVKVPCDTGAVHTVVQEAVTHEDDGKETDVLVPCDTGSLHKVKQEVDESNDTNADMGSGDDFDFYN